MPNHGAENQTIENLVNHIENNLCSIENLSRRIAEKLITGPIPMDPGMTTQEVSPIRDRLSLIAADTDRIQKSLCETVSHITQDTIGAPNA